MSYVCWATRQTASVSCGAVSPGDTACGRHASMLCLMQQPTTHPTAHTTAVHSMRVTYSQHKVRVPSDCIHLQCSVSLQQLHPPSSLCGHRCFQSINQSMLPNHSCGGEPSRMQCVRLSHVDSRPTSSNHVTRCHRRLSQNLVSVHDADSLGALSQPTNSVQLQTGGQHAADHCWQQQRLAPDSNSYSSRAAPLS